MSDNPLQVAYLYEIAAEFGFSSVDEFFNECPRTFDLICSEWRKAHPI